MTLPFRNIDRFTGSIGRRITRLAATRPFLFYSLLVLSIYAAIYLPLPLPGKTYIYLDIGTDTHDSYWPMYAFIRDYFHSFQFDGWSYQHGLGASLISAAPLIFDPFDVFILPFSKENIDTGIFLAATAKVWALALLTYGYMARLGYRGVPLIASSISYTFCGYFVGWGQHYHFATMFVLFTLVLYCFEGWLQSRRWPGLVLSIALLAAFWPYTLYMTLVFLAGYTPIRFLQLLPFKGRHLLVRGLSTAGLLVWGIALGAVFFLPQVHVLRQSARITAQVLPGFLLATGKEYYTIYMRMFSNGLLGVNEFHGHLNYYEAPFLYTGILTIVVLPRLFLKDVRRQSYVWILLVCGLLLLLPRFANPLFGALSSHSYRWTFVLVPVFAAALAQALTVIQNDSYRWIYGPGILLAAAAGVAALTLHRPFPDDSLGWSLPVSAAIVIVSAMFYGAVLVRSRAPAAPWLLILLVLEVALTGFVSVNWRSTLPVSAKKETPYFDPSTGQALERIFSVDKSFFRINKNYHEFYLADALFQGFYGEKQYSSITPGYIRDMQELFGLTEPRSNYLTGFSGRQPLRDISAVKYMLSSQEHAYAGYEYIAQAGNVHIFRNNNASSIGMVYEDFITLENFKRLDQAARQYILYDAVVVPSRSAQSLSDLKEIDTPSLTRSSAVSLDEDIKKNKVRIVENDFPRHLEVVLRGVESYLVVEFSEPAGTSIDIAFSVTSPVRSTGRVFFRTPQGSFNHSDSIAFTLQPGTHEYYMAVPVIGVDAIRLQIAPVAGRFSLDRFAVFHRDDEGIARQAARLSSGLSIDTFENDYVRATADLERAGLVYFSIPFDPGWKIQVDGAWAEKIQANIAFTGVYVGPGRHTIELTYSIPWLWEGATISLLAFVLLVILLARTRRSQAGERARYSSGL